ncbi:MAG: HAD family hydrolase [Bdellovibrionota bacterium]
MTSKNHPTLFLDRDGTVNIDIGPRYINDPKDASLIPGAAQAIIRARDAGFKIALVTNQAGVAKGFTAKENLPIVHRRIEELIRQESGVSRFAFDDIQVCVHHPDERCKCRKPETQMLEASIGKLGTEIERSFFVGDKSSDLICAHRMGMRSILVRTGHGNETAEELSSLPGIEPVGIVPTLAEAVDLAIRLRDALLR